MAPALTLPRVSLLLELRAQRWSIGALAFLLACATAPDPVVEDKRAALIGMSKRQLDRCLEATDIRLDDVDKLIYRWYSERRSIPVTVSPREDGPGRPTVERPKGKLANPDTGRPVRGVTFCELVFEMKDDRVSAVAAQGVDANGLTDRRCILDKALRCG